MKKIILVSILIFSILCFWGCSGKADKESNTTPSTTQKPAGKYANSKYIGSWYNADSANDELVCILNDDGTATFKADAKATWEETPTGITITTTVDGTQTTMEGYFVITGDGYVARATEANMHYLDEGGTLQLEIMLTENTCVDCIKK